MSALPLPGPDALAHSARLLDALRAEIEAAGGWLPFARYMELALYAPGLGYYSAGAKKFGREGDFFTAPELSPLFARTLARQAAQVLQATGGDILELGAGTGALAAELLLALEALDCLPERYSILEVSADLRAVQQARLMQLPAHLAGRVHWCDALPDRMCGLVLGNEVLDALPVHILAWRDSGIAERGVAWRAGALAWDERPLQSAGLRAQANALALPAGYVSELCPAAGALVASLADRLEHGALLFVDYGFPRREYYHPQRACGTLMCHYRQHAHDDPLWHPGLQDMTAHVDFTAIAEAGVAHGLEVCGYASQAQFLINCGITDLLGRQSPADPARYLPWAAQVQKLLSPAEMGELFKVMLLTRGELPSPVGFLRGDKRHVL